ncbi:MAG: family 78 glycoside hydrolase catalytic domain, partial [Bacteroidota bacterium]
MTSRHPIALLIILNLLGSWQGAIANEAIRIDDLRTEYLSNPLGIDETAPRFSWKLLSNAKNKSQSRYRILVADSEALLDTNVGNQWDSDTVSSRSNKHIVYRGTPLTSGKAYYWKVKVWDEKGQESPWSETGYWSMGLLSEEDWKAKWVGFETKDYDDQDTLFLPAAPYLRKNFSTQHSIKRAMVYVSALGLFEISLNGAKIGQDLFVPGWTDYNQRVYYKTYDITEQLKTGENAFGAILADGWYSGYLGPYSLGRPRNRELYGTQPALLCQVEIEYEDGRTQTIVSDESWRASEGPIIYADMLMGESYNANRELGSWNQPSFDNSAWKNVYHHPGPTGVLEAYPAHNIRSYSELSPQEIAQPEEGVYIFDLGQNFAGYSRLKVKGNRNDTIVIRYGEMLHPDGTLMTENLRFARATDTYVLKGGETESWEPKFTYHGFRYVEVSGLRSKPDQETITGIAISSNTPRVGHFTSSDSLVNTLYRNIVWTQRSNFLDVPTDCPQRDERLGWLGDAQIFSKSAIYNCDLRAFYAKWMVDVVDAQYDFGPYANFAPRPYPDLVWYSPGWMEAGLQSATPGCLLRADAVD